MEQKKLGARRSEVKKRRGEDFRGLDVLNQFHLQPNELHGKKIGTLGDQMQDLTLESGAVDLNSEVADKDFNFLLVDGIDPRVDTEWLKDQMAKLVPGGELRVVRPTFLVAQELKKKAASHTLKSQVFKLFKADNQWDEERYEQALLSQDFWVDALRLLDSGTQRALFLDVENSLSAAGFGVKVLGLSDEPPLPVIILTNPVKELRHKVSIFSRSAQERRLNNIEKAKSQDIRLRGIFGQQILAIWERMSPEEQASDSMSEDMTRSFYVTEREVLNLLSREGRATEGYSHFRTLCQEATNDPLGVKALEYVGVNITRTEFFLQADIEDKIQKRQMPVEFFVVLAKLWKKKMQPWFETDPPRVDKYKDRFKRVIFEKYLQEKFQLTLLGLNGL